MQKEMLKEILRICSSVRDDIADLKTRRALPTEQIEMIDPFLFLNHHGPQTYSKNNRGLPFGPHPHRGFETVTFILEGDILHEDSAGHKSVIGPGGIQWMTAGSGLVHSETSSDNFKSVGGPLEILQLWVNLPAKLKMNKPNYIGLQRDQIPVIFENDKKVKVEVISGDWKGQPGAVQPLVDISLQTLAMTSGGSTTIEVPDGHNVFFYVVRGKIDVNHKKIEAFNLVEFSENGNSIQIEALSDDVFILFGHAKPFREAVVSHGPFVMNTREEIRQAISDYQEGKFS